MAQTVRPNRYDGVQKYHHKYKPADIETVCPICGKVHTNDSLYCHISCARVRLFTKSSNAKKVKRAEKWWDSPEAAPIKEYISYLVDKYNKKLSTQFRPRGEIIFDYTPVSPKDLEEPLDMFSGYDKAEDW